MSGIDIKNMQQKYEKTIHDLKQLIEISRSLASTLEFPALIDSILYICLTQMKVLNVGLFLKDQMQKKTLELYRNYKGFNIDHRKPYSIPVESDCAKMLLSMSRACTMQEILERAHPDSPQLAMMQDLRPSLIVPLRLKDELMGILIMGEGPDVDLFSEDQKEYIQTICLFAAAAVHNAILYEMATTDMMTQLRLRNFFLSSMNKIFEQTVREQTTLSLIFIDIDHFKRLNDTYGHACGDYMLTRVSDILHNSIRKVDIGCRYGGDECVILLPGAGMEMATAVAERIRKKIETGNFIYEGEKLTTSISAGVAELDINRDFTSESLIKRADQALYRAKEKGRNQTVQA